MDRTGRRVTGTVGLSGPTDCSARKDIAEANRQAPRLGGDLRVNTMTQIFGRVLVVEDEPDSRRFLRCGLRSHGFEVLEAYDGQEAILRTSLDKPSVIVLDLSLPDLQGLEVIRRVREGSDAPIIALAEPDDSTDKIGALRSGANDYLSKPFGTGTIAARVRAALRHRRQVLGRTRSEFRLGPLLIDLARQLIRRGSTEMKLSPRETSLLRMLVQHAGRAVTSHELLANVWGPKHHFDIELLHNYVGRLRQKLEPNPAVPRFLMTERGIGYRLVDELPPDARPAMPGGAASGMLDPAWV